MKKVYFFNENFGRITDLLPPMAIFCRQVFLKVCDQFCIVCQSLCWAEVPKGICVVECYIFGSQWNWFSIILNATILNRICHHYPCSQFFKDIMIPKIIPFFLWSFLWNTQIITIYESNLFGAIYTIASIYSKSPLNREARSTMNPAKVATPVILATSPV